MSTSSGPGWLWRQYSSGCHLLELGDPHTIWVFGLQWLPTVSARSRKLLLAQLHREKVRWWTTPTGRSHTIGFLPLVQASEAPKVDARLRCAAAHFALKHPKGAHLFRLTLDSGLHWIVAVSDGNVLCRTDCWFDSDSSADQLEQSILQRFDQVHVTHCVLGAESSFDDSALAFLQKDHVPAQIFMKRLRPPLPLRTAGLVLIVLAASAVWVWSGQPEREMKAAHSASSGLGHEGRSQPFEIRVSQRGDLNRIANLWADLPLSPDGWLLQGVSCPIVAEQANCHARYKRIALESSNLQLQVVEGTGWKMQPLSLDQTEFIRSLSIGRPRLLQESASDGKQSWLVQLQKISGLIYTVDLGAPSISKSESGAHPVRRIRLVLPLKHLKAIDALPIPVVWSAIHLEILDPQIHQPRTTRLLTYLEGELIDQS